MKDSVKPKIKPNTHRDLFAELCEGMKALAEERLGKRTLRNHPHYRPKRPSSLGEVIALVEFEQDENGRV